MRVETQSTLLFTPRLRPYISDDHNDRVREKCRPLHVDDLFCFSWHLPVEVPGTFVKFASIIIHCSGMPTERRKHINLNINVNKQTNKFKVLRQNAGPIEAENDYSGLVQKTYTIVIFCSVTREFQRSSVTM